MEAEINEHPLGFELRVYVQGEFHYSQAHKTREWVEAEAAERKQELLALGWTERPVSPEGLE